ncbi:hypothetical protein D3C86_702730 [compost metagenome]
MRRCTSTSGPGRSGVPMPKSTCSPRMRDRNWSGAQSFTSTRTFGCCSPKARSASGNKNPASVGVMASVTRPRSSVASSRKSAESESTSRSTRSTVEIICSAAAVGLSARVVRSNRRVPRPSSSWRISMLTADCVTNSRVAAAPSLRSW